MAGSGHALFLAKTRCPPEDPYAYVTRPEEAQPPYRSAAALADRPED